MQQELELINSARQGNSMAFRDLVVKYQKRIYNLAFDLTSNHQDAEDLSQDVFILMHRALHKFRGDAALSTWLYRITIHTWINSKRRKNARLKHLFEFFPDGSADTLAEKIEYSPEAHTEQALMYDHIQQAMQQLSDRERTVFALRQLHDKKLEEIALILEIKQGTVKSLLHRSLQKMQKALSFYHPQHQEAE